MNPVAIQHNMLLLCFIVNHSLGRKTLKQAKKMGVTGGTVFLGHGTVSDELLNLFELCDTRKEIVLMIAPEQKGHEIIKQLSDKLNIEKKSCGIAFSVHVNSLYGSRSYEKQINTAVTSSDEQKSAADSQPQNRDYIKPEEPMYKAIYTIVDKGRGEEVIKSAGDAGARGGTIINARGSGIHETAKLFAMEIEPEKEMVLIVLKSEKTDAVINAITKDLELEKPGKGILFVLDVADVFGLRK